MSNTNMYLSQEDRSNNQLFLDVYFLQDRMRMNISEMEEYQEKMKTLKKRIEGKEWVVSTADKNNKIKNINVILHQSNKMDSDSISEVMSFLSK